MKNLLNIGISFIVCAVAWWSTFKSYCNHDFPWEAFIAASIFIILFHIAYIAFFIMRAINKVDEANEATQEKLDRILTNTQSSLKYLIENSEKLSKMPANSDSPSASSTTPKAPDVWICPKCGATNPAGTKFCTNCGK